MLRLPPGLLPLLLGVQFDPGIQGPARSVIREHDRRYGPALPISEALSPSCLLHLLVRELIASTSQALNSVKKPLLQSNE
jgi:hypothetical protein